MATVPQRLERLRRQVTALASGEMPAERDALSLWARVTGYAPDAWQARVLTSDSRRIILNCCRQSGKSSCASILALADALLQPESLVLLLSPSLRQSQELARKVFQGYAKLSRPVPSASESRLVLELRNGSRVVALPGADDSSIRGYSHVSRLILDEASRCSDDLYRAVRPMVSVSQGKILLLSTPYGRRGFFYETWTEAPGWLKIRVPAHECPRLSPDFLSEERAALGEAWYRQEYENSFEEVDDAVFDYDLVQRALDPSVKPLIEVSPSGEGIWVGSLD
jgi:hypothetical protein